MYIPKYAEVTDRLLLKNFMQEHSFATLITSASDPDDFATGGHYPFLVDDDGSEFILWTHLARSNPQWKNLNEQKALVIFTGPHSYISPTLYKNPLNVPTWSYTAVHADCTTEIISDPDLEKNLMRRLVEHFEAANGSAWNYDLPEDFHERLLKAIVWLKFKAIKLEGKFKLSQNREKLDYDGVLEYFSKQTSDNGKALLNYMRLTSPVRR